MFKSNKISHIGLYAYVFIVLIPSITAILILFGALPQLDQWSYLMKVVFSVSFVVSAIVVFRFLVFLIKVSNIIEKTYRNNLFKRETKTYTRRPISLFHMINKLQEHLRILGLENRILYDTSLAIHTSTSLKELLDTLLGRLRTHLHSDFAIVFLLTENHLNVEYTNNIHIDSLDKKRFRIGEGIVGESIYKDTVILSHDLTKDPRYIKCVEDCKSQITIPLKIYKEMFGVLVLGSYNKNHFDEKDVKLLKTISTEIALAINSAKLTEQLRLEKEQVDTLYNTSQEIASSIDLETVMYTGITKIAELSESKTCSLMLFDKEDKVLKIRASVGLSQQSIDNVTLGIGEGLAGKAFEENKILAIENATQSPYFKNIPNQVEKFTHIYSIPLSTGEETIGVLNIDTHIALTEEKQSLIESVVAQISKSLSNALLYQAVGDLAVKDDLTGFYNKRYFNQALDMEINRSLRYQRSLSLVACDIDNFKIFNDTFGHQVGDFILKSVCKIIDENTRDSDILCRYGGDELFLILPETEVENAEKLMTRIITEISSINFYKKLTKQNSLNVKDNNLGKSIKQDENILNQFTNWINNRGLSRFKKSKDKLQVTISVGISNITDLTDLNLNVEILKEEIVRKADQALLAAKGKGKNIATQWSELNN